MGNRKIKILIAEDLSTDVELLLRELKRFKYSFEHKVVDNRKEFLHTLLEQKPDIVLSDYQMNRFNGMEALELVKKHAPHTPVIIVTGSMNEETAVECMKAGAADYVIKEHLRRLEPAIRQALEQKSLKQEKDQYRLKLEESERHFRFIAERANDFIYIFTLFPQPHFQYVSPSVLILLGYTPDELYCSPELFYEKVLHPDDKTTFRSIFDHKQFESPITLRFIRNDGRVIWIEQQNSGIYGEHDELTAIQAIARDITRRKQIEEELRRTENGFLQMMYSSDDAIGLVDENNRFIDCNSAAARLHGFNSREEFLAGNPHPGKISPSTLSNGSDALEVANRMIELAREKGFNRFEWIHTRTDGSNFPAQVTLTPIILKGKKLIYAVWNDISRQKELQESLKRSELNFRVSIEESPLGIRIVNPQGKTTYVNQAFLTIFGYADKDEIERKPPSSLYLKQSKNEHKQRKELRKFGKSKSIERYEIGIRLPNGKEKYLLVSRKSIFWNGIEQYMVMYQDITERKSYEVELKKAKEKAEESDKLKTSFLANLSHEIRTPMNAIVGFSDLLKTPNLKDEKRFEYVEIIQKSGLRLLDIINETIEIAKLDAGLIKIKPEVFDVNRMVKDIYNEMSFKADQKGNLDFRLFNTGLDSELKLFTDRVKLQQILTNLISNAIKYTPRGSVVFGYEIIDNDIVFRVKDTGIGIDRQNQPLVFRRFHRVENPITIKASGIGLGLAIAKSYTELLGGTIKLESEKGQGTVVSVSLPYTVAETEVQFFENIPEQALKGNSESILVAEDDEFNYIFIEEILTQNGYSCIWAKNGKEAVEHVHSNEEIKLVLMDLKMPDMNGYQAYNAIREFNSKLPIIAQTAYALQDERKHILQHGFTDYIAKPLKKKELLSIIAKNLKAISR